MGQGNLVSMMNHAIVPALQPLAGEDFEQLARPCYDRVYLFVAKQVNDRTEAQDITQKIFIRAYRGFDRYDSDRPFAPWLFRIARRAIADHFRRRAAPDDTLPNCVADPAPGTVERVEQAECHDTLWALARQLKPKLHQVLYLYYSESFSLREVAQIMGVTTPHAKVLLFRARLALKKVLETAEGKEIGL